MLTKEQIFLIFYVKNGFFSKCEQKPFSNDKNLIRIKVYVIGYYIILLVTGAPGTDVPFFLRCMAACITSIQPSGQFELGTSENFFCKEESWEDLVAHRRMERHIIF